MTDAQVFEFNPTGTSDSAFSNPMFTFTGVQHASAISTAIQSNGEVVVGGSQCDGGSCVDGLARLNSNGRLDASFGNHGVVTTSFSSGHDFGYDFLLIQSTGDIVAIGGAEFTVTDAFSGLSNGQEELTLARYSTQ